MHDSIYDIIKRKNNVNLEKPSRADLTEAWSEGLEASKAGKPRAANPYLGVNKDLAKNGIKAGKKDRALK